MVGSATDGIRRDNKFPREWMGMSAEECDGKLEKNDRKYDEFRKWFMTHEFGDLKRRSENNISRRHYGDFVVGVRWVTVKLARVGESIPYQQTRKLSEESRDASIRRSASSRTWNTAKQTQEEK